MVSIGCRHTWSPSDILSTLILTTKCGDFPKCIQHSPQMSKYGRLRCFQSTHTVGIFGHPMRQQRKQGEKTAVRIQSRLVHAAAIPNDPIAGATKPENESNGEKGATRDETS